MDGVVVTDVVAVVDDELLDRPLDELRLPVGPVAPFGCMWFNTSTTLQYSTVNICLSIDRCLLTDLPIVGVAIPESFGERVASYLELRYLLGQSE